MNNFFSVDIKNNSKSLIISKKICYVIGIFGSKYDGMLLTLLYSLNKNIQALNCFVFYQDNSSLFDEIKKAFTKVEFIKTSFNFSKNHNLRISSKTLLWSKALEWLCQHKISVYNYTIFLDVDTIVLNNPLISLNSLNVLDADIIITVKDNEIWPINTGVIITKISHRTSCFFKLWKTSTFDLFKNADSIHQANSLDYPYGGIDQMSMYKIIQYLRNEDIFYTNQCDGLTIKKVLCENFNQTNSSKINNDTFIIHYKGGWQPILLNGKNFTKNRKKNESMPMYVYYIETYKSAVKYLRSISLDRRHNYSNCGISVPLYMNTHKKLSKFLFYQLHCFNNNIISFSQFVKRIYEKFIR